MANAGYTNLLAHLHNPSTSLPLSTIQSALAHHLAKLSPLPTPLAAIAVSSPLFSVHPFSHPKLQALSTAFRHATHLKYRDCKDSNVGTSVFARSTKTRVKQWANAVLKGIKGGHPVLRLACCGGLLAGLDDIKAAEHLDIPRSPLEDETVISVAESMDLYSRIASEWEAEFRPVGDVDTMTLALILASQSLVLVAPGKLGALPLAVLTELLTRTIVTTFASGSFLSPSSSSTLSATDASPLMEFIAQMSKLTALSVSVLCETRPAEGMAAAAATLQTLRPVSKRLETDWSRNPLAEVSPDHAALVWKTFKTLLFANIMISDAILSASIFIPPPIYATTHDLRPSGFALTVLHTLSDLSFVVSQFGGVTTTASPGFVELKKTFYLALDILSKNAEESDTFVRELCLSVQDWKSRGNQESDVQAKLAYALTSIEQLVPVLNVDCIQSCALPLALPHLSDPTHRETYESSHSVVLAIFASHADHHAAKSDVSDGPSFTERLVPFYAHCLMENSIDGRLNTPQLRLAFASLVRSASTSAHRGGDLIDSNYTLAWYCVDALLDISDHLSDQDAERLHRLRLTLISAVPSLPLKLLPPVLEVIRTFLVADGSQPDKLQELVDATFEEISQRVGDVEKQYALRWWASFLRGEESAGDFPRRRARGYESYGWDMYGDSDFGSAS
ncbi:hypothetical protein FB45DRAFT_824461 [Roridomyces roridus]|uniref:Uncharacterized protein n=1 Tax=Roridomyces roridus TaxID=1738132 RepID=A0AAD7FY41_9AGAR|nr:hypothetical protein FB45DRAFT_824461 [Roridomyces roridus]